MTEVEEVVSHLDAIMELAGLDKSESATERLVELLCEAAKKAKTEIRDSHKQGLCLDCRWSIAETLLGVGLKYAVFVNEDPITNAKVGHIVPTRLPETEDTVEACYGHTLSDQCVCHPKLMDRTPISYAHNCLEVE